MGSTFGRILEFVLVLLMCGLFLGLVFMLTIGPYINIKNEIKQYHSIIKTVEIARNGNISEFERAALTNKIIESNQWLASVQYWNERFLIGLYIPNEVMELEPIK